MTTNVIQKDMIFLDKPFNSQEEIIDFILKEANSENLITETLELKQAIIDRENQVSTAVGFKIAMPHGKAKSVNQPFVSFLRLDQSIKWSEKNAEQVQMIILIAVPEGNVGNTHLKIISSLSKKLLDDRFRNQLMNESNTEVIYQLLQTINIP